MIAAQPVLLLFMWIGSWHVLLTSSNERLGFEDAGLGETVGLWWAVLTLSAPIMVGAAFLAIRYRTGRWRVWGMWLRLGGDVGMCAALATYLMARLIILHHTAGDSPLFALNTLAGVLVLCLVWVVRDVAALLLLERTAARIRNR